MPLCSKAGIFFLLKKSNNSGRVCRSVNVLAFVAKAADYRLSANASGMGNVPQTSPELSSRCNSSVCELQRELTLAQQPKRTLGYMTERH